MFISCVNYSLFYSILLDFTFTRVNLLKAKSLNSRLYSELCSDEKHKTLLLHTEVRWLSRGRVLGRLFELREKVREFLSEIQSEFITYFESNEFMLRLGYCLAY